MVLFAKSGNSDTELEPIWLSETETKILEFSTDNKPRQVTCLSFHTHAYGNYVISSSFMKHLHFIIVLPFKPSVLPLLLYI